MGCSVPLGSFRPPGPMVKCSVGPLQQEKRGRQALRGIAETGIVVKSDPDSATYRVVEGNPLTR